MNAIGDQRAGRAELAHYFMEGDGAAGIAALVDGFGDRGVSIETTQYADMRLQVKSRILREDPPDVWVSWPGEELATYAEAGVIASVTDLWERSGMASNYRQGVAESARVDGEYYGVPLHVHRVNDLYLDVELVEAAGVDPGSADDPEELVRVLETLAAEREGPPFVLPMADPFPVLQLWEVSLLGLSDARTVEAIADGEARAHRDLVRRAVSVLDDFASLAAEDSIYQGLTDANEAFVDGTAPVYQQGDWAGGEFDKAAGFEYERDWERIAFPGTEGSYGLVMDALVAAAGSDPEAYEPVLEYAGSPEAQERFSREKGSVPAREDAAIDGASAFGRAQQRALDRSTAQVPSITHGLSVTPAQLVDLKTAAATFVDERDVDATTDAIVDVLSE